MCQCACECTCVRVCVCVRVLLKFKQTNATNAITLYVHEHISGFILTMYKLIYATYVGYSHVYVCLCMCECVCLSVHLTVQRKPPPQ